MGIAATLKGSAAVVASITMIGGGLYTLDNRHAPRSVMTEVGVMELFDLVEIAQRDGKSEWICRAIDQKVIALCSEDPDHYLCADADAVKDLKRKAGCDPGQ